MNEEVKKSSNEIAANNQSVINNESNGGFQEPINFANTQESDIVSREVSNSSINESLAPTEPLIIFGEGENNSLEPEIDTDNLLTNTEMQNDSVQPDFLETPKTPEENLEFEDFREKKSKKGLIIGVIILIAVIIIAILGGKYFLSKNTAESFLENNITKLTTNINNLIGNETSDLKDIYKDDLISNINLKLTTDAKDLKAYNNIELNAKTNINLNDNYADIDATLKQNTANLNGNLVLTRDKLYIDSKDIFSKGLYIDMEEDYFKTIEEYLEEYEDTLSTSDIKALITNLGKYINDALKKTNMTTKYNGLTITYTYEVNDNNKKDIIMSLENSLKNDEIIKKLASEVITLEDIYLDNIKVELTLNIFNQKLESGLITTDDTQLTIEKLEDNKYQIKEKDNNEEFIEIDTSNDTITAAYFKDGNSVATINLKNTDKEFILVLNSDEVNMNLAITNGDTKNIKLEAKYDKYVINLDMDMKLNSNNQILDGDISIKMNDETIKVMFTTDSKWGNNLFTKKKINNASSINNLTSEEQTEVLTNVLTKITAFPFYSELSNLQTPRYDDNEYYYGL